MRTSSALFAVLFVGCFEHLHDPAVVFEERDGGVSSGEAAVLIGLFREQFFVPLREGDPLPILFGTQGGTWVMPGIRARGFDLQGSWTGTVTTGSGEVVGRIENAPVRLNRAPDGWQEVTAVPIPIGHAPPNETDSIDDLYGQDAVLEIRLQDDNTTLETRVDVTLTRG